jgi:hypothetical protein
MSTVLLDTSSIQINESSKHRHEIAWAYCAASTSLLLIAPILAFIFTGIVLIDSRHSFPKAIRLYLASTMIISLSMMAGARPIDPDQTSNDIDGYYQVYQAISDGDLSNITHFGAGIEVGLTLLFYIFSLLLPPLSINGLMFCLAFVSSFLLLIWIEKTFYTGHHMRHTALIGTCILMLNLYFSTQLVRQFFSLIILLYAFSATGRIKQLTFVVLAAMFHATAIPYYLLFLIIRKGRIGWMFAIVLAFVLRYTFSYLVEMQDFLPMLLALKLRWYVDIAETNSSTDLASFRMIFLLSCISLLILIAKRFKPPAEAKPWLAVPWISGIVHLILLPIPLVALRTTMLVHSITPGLLVHKMFEGGGLSVRMLRIMVLNLLIVYKIAVYITAGESGNLFSTLHMLTDFVQ